MSAGFTLYYWPIPFRGHFPRAVLAEAGAAWDEPGVDAVAELKARAASDQPVPHMAPPVLVDHAAGVTLAQMPAILDHLGARFGLMPADAALAGLTRKVIGDASDVLYEITRHHGALMWTRDDWQTFERVRLPRWMAIFEETGRRHGLRAETGHLLGGDAPGLADLVCAMLWGPMLRSMPALAPRLEATAPGVAGLTARICARPTIAAMLREGEARFGDAYCGGQIEASLREMLG